MWELIWFLTFPGNPVPMETASPAIFTNHAACEIFKVDEIARIEKYGLVDFQGNIFFLDKIEGQCQIKKQEKENA